MAGAPQSLIKWVTAQFGDIQGDGLPNRFELFHSVEGGEGMDRIHLFEFEETGLPEVEEFCQELYDIAEHDASTRSSGMIQRYVVMSFRPDSGDNEQPAATHPFILRSGRASPFLSGETEPANEKGVIAQVLRHNENQNRLMHHMAESTAGRLMRDLESERQARIKADERAVKLIEMQEELLDRKADRELNQATSLMKARRIDEMTGLLMSMLPLLLSKFVGGEGAKNLQASGLRDQAIGKILKGLSQEEALSVMNALKPANKMAFVELYKSFAEDDKAEQAKKPALLQDEQPEEAKH